MIRGFESFLFFFFSPFVPSPRLLDFHLGATLVSIRIDTLDTYTFGRRAYFRRATTDFLRTSTSNMNEKVMRGRVEYIGREKMEFMVSRRSLVIFRVIVFQLFSFFSK